LYALLQVSDCMAHSLAMIEVPIRRQADTLDMDVELLKA
jgi:hypothetical protein